MIGRMTAFGAASKRPFVPRNKVSVFVGRLVEPVEDARLLLLREISSHPFSCRRDIDGGQFMAG